MASDSEESLGVPLSDTLTLNWKEGCASKSRAETVLTAPVLSSMAKKRRACSSRI